jgi:hypothetical protein
MVTTLVLAAIIAGPPEDPSAEPFVRVPAATVECRREVDRIVCVIPLTTLAMLPMPAPSEPALTVTHHRKARPYKPSPPEPGRPAPEAAAELKAADADVALAGRLLASAQGDFQAVLAQQMLYHSQERRRMALAGVRPARPRAIPAEDPFERGELPAKPAPDLAEIPMGWTQRDLEWMAVCGNDVEECNDDGAAHRAW